MGVPPTFVAGKIQRPACGSPSTGGRGTMKKLRLDFGKLAVESFGMDEAKVEKGSVQATPARSTTAGPTSLGAVRPCNRAVHPCAVATPVAAWPAEPTPPVPDARCPGSLAAGAFLLGASTTRFDFLSTFFSRARGGLRARQGAARSSGANPQRSTSWPAGPGGANS